MNPLRILFAGSPAIAQPSLAMIAETSGSRWILAGVLTNPDSRRSRGGGTESTDIGTAAALLEADFARRGLPVPALLKPESLKAEAREAVSALKPDLLVSFAYGRIFGPRFMALFPLGGINVHPSLLPRYRGASPIQEAILRRDAETGVSVQRIAAEMDTGNILARETIPLSLRETSAVLSESAALLGAKLLRTVLEQFAGGVSPEGIPQEGGASYCTLIDKDSGIINWEKSAEEIDAHIRAYNPWPLARTSHKGEIVNILEASPCTGIGNREWSLAANDQFAKQTGSPGAARRIPQSPIPNPHKEAGQVLGTDKEYGILVQTGRGVLGITRLQYRSRKALHWQAFLNGARDFTASRLTGGS